ncbi:hypothetical protein U0070_010331 [Myodes glareolus]|uniref:H/ACA ribonucleoprotein complex subunit 2 n=1 Tax=Myodes glareolus TaxID=447135 RepID=A0AAW0IP04_MYOGA
MTEADVNPKAYPLADAHLTKKLLGLGQQSRNYSSSGKEPMKPAKPSTEASLSSSSWQQTLSCWRSSCTSRCCVKTRMSPVYSCAPSRP